MGNKVKMRSICAWCQKETAVKKPQSGSDDAPISHGICPDCARKVLSYRAESLRSLLDRFSDPVFFISTEKVGDAVLLRIDEICEEKSDSKIII